MTGKPRGITLPLQRSQVDKPPSRPPLLCIDGEEYMCEKASWYPYSNTGSFSVMHTKPVFHELALCDGRVCFVFKTRIIPSWIRLSFFSRTWSVKRECQPLGTCDVLQGENDAMMFRDKQENLLTVSIAVSERQARYLRIDLGYEMSNALWKPSEATYYVKIKRTWKRRK